MSFLFLRWPGAGLVSLEEKIILRDSRSVKFQMSHKNIEKWWETGGQFTDKITSSKPNQSVYRWDTRKVMSSLTDVTTAYQGLIRTIQKEKSPTKPLKKWAVLHSAALVREFGWIRIPREVSIQSRGYPQSSSIQKARIFHEINHKPSSYWGTPHFRKPPYLSCFSPKHQHQQGSKKTQPVSSSRSESLDTPGRWTSRGDITHFLVTLGLYPNKLFGGFMGVNSSPWSIRQTRIFKKCPQEFSFKYIPWFSWASCRFSFELWTNPVDLGWFRVQDMHHWRSNQDFRFEKFGSDPNPMQSEFCMIPWRKVTYGNPWDKAM